jgi:hypothetical protein
VTSDTQPQTTPEAEQTTDNTTGQSSGCKSFAAPVIVLALMACVTVVITKKKD